MSLLLKAQHHINDVVPGFFFCYISGLFPRIKPPMSRLVFHAESEYCALSITEPVHSTIGNRHVSLYREKAGEEKARERRYSIMLSAISLPICTDCLSCPNCERSDKRPDLLIPQQERNILGSHIRVGKIGLCQQLPCMVELLLKVGIFLLQLALQRAFAVTKLLCHIVNGTFSTGQQLHQGAADTGGVAVIRLHHRQAAF